MAGANQQQIDKRIDSDKEIDESQELQTHELDTHPECSVCLQLCLQPVILPCHHIFCFLCVKGFAYRSKKCALCRKEIHLDYFKSPVIVKVKKQEDNCEKTLGSTEQNEMFYWFYEGRNGWWEYDERASSVLEKAFCSEEKDCELVIAGFPYIANFKNMVQFRKSNPARWRRIKRDTSVTGRKGIAGLKTVPVASKSNCIQSETDSHEGDQLAECECTSDTLSSLSVVNNESELDDVEPASMNHRGSIHMNSPVTELEDRFSHLVCDENNEL